MSTTSSRYDSQQYLDRWRLDGSFPAIHDGVTTALAAIPASPGYLLDLGSSVGLTTRRLADAGWKVDALDADAQALARGAAAGTYAGLRYEHLAISQHTYRGFLDRLDDRLPDMPDPRVVLARRFLPEVSPHLGPRFGDFFAALADRFHHLVVEPRIVSSRTTHRLGTPAAERDAVLATGRWQLTSATGTANRPVYTFAA